MSSRRAGRRLRRAPSRRIVGHLEEHYTRRIRALPEPTQQLLLLAAADPTGDATLLWRAAQTLGVARSAAAAAESEQLLEIGSHVRFRHPLVRSAAYAAGTADGSLRRARGARRGDGCRGRSGASRVAPGCRGDGTGRSRRLGARATAAAAQARAGLAAAAAFLERSVQLTAEPERRAERALAAAHAHLHAGAFDAALGLLAEARALAIDDVQRGRIERLKGQVQYASNPGPEAPVLLVEAARALEPLDVQLARETYLDAWMASFAAGPRARPGGLLPEVSRAARSAPPAPTARRRAICSSMVSRRWSPTGVPRAQRVCDARWTRSSATRSLTTMFVQWGHLATSAACMLWDWQSWEILEREARRARSALWGAGPVVDRLERARRLRRLVRRLRGGDRARRRVRRGQRGDAESGGTRPVASCRPPTRVGRRRWR